ncbi:MAG: TetR/AcrR family transcriptional regulator [Flavobacteriales bacterium]
MEEKIIHFAGDLFLTYGFKSITMDEIASKMGISKKTIYKYFKTKTHLVEATTLHIFKIVSEGINCIFDIGKNPIEELFEIKDFVMKHLKDESSSPHYQLKKYYPEIYSNLYKKQFEVMQECVIENLQRGVDQKLYLADLDIELISRIYFLGITGIKDEELFPRNLFLKSQLLENYLNYHIRGIATPKGLKILDTFINKN